MDTTRAAQSEAKTPWLHPGGRLQYRSKPPAPSMLADGTWTNMKELIFSDKFGFN